MPGSGPGDLQALCEELLQASIDALDTIPTFDATLEGAPERYFVSPGLPVLDCCPQLSVHAAGVTEADTTPGGLGAGRRASAARLNHVALVVTIARCIPGEPTPPADDLEAAAEQINADGWALWNHIWNLIRADLLFSLCGEVFWDGLRPLSPSGLCAGWTLNLRVRLDGYSEVLGS